MTGQTTGAGVEGASPLGGEQVGEVLVYEELFSVIGQEGVDGPLFDQPPAQGRGIEEVAVGIGFALHGQFSPAGWQIASLSALQINSALVSWKLIHCEMPFTRRR